MCCRGRLSTKLDCGKHKIIKLPQDHNHEPIANRIEVLKTNEYIKQQARDSTRPPSQIINAGLITCKSNCRVYLPKKEAFKNKIKYVRRNTIKEPTSLESITIPTHLMHVEGDLFVLSEKAFGKNRIIVMGTIKSIYYLSETKIWLMDGTFNVVPSIMTQLFTIHGRIGDVTIPLLFCLMSAKSQECYNEVFYEILHIACSNNIELKPKYMMTDFEIAMINASKNYFPNALHKACYFHFGQILYRRIQHEKLTSKYGSDEKFSLNMRMLKCLAFLPDTEILKYYETIKPDLCKNSRKILPWFEKNYLYGTKNCSPRFPPLLWSINELITDHMPRTQNNVEAWHRRLKIIVGRSHVGVYKLIKDLQVEYINSMTMIEKVVAGNTKKLNRELVSKNNNIERILENQLSLNPLIFLKGLAYNINLN